MTQDFLFELGCEELPSAAVSSLIKALMNNVEAALANAMITYQAINPFATPRRLGLLIENIALSTPETSIIRRGPAFAVAFDSAGNPTPALHGFAKSCGVAIDALTTSHTEKGQWFVYETIHVGVKTADILPTLIGDAIDKLPQAKSMRWGETDILFARPVHWLVMLLGDVLLPSTILGLQANQYSQGHRFHAPQACFIKQASDYEALLEKAFVIADFNKRRALILEQVNRLAVQHQALAIIPDDLLDEVTAIVEWPTALIVAFDDSFLTIPAEALIAAMQIHQKCFALRDANNQLMPYFITVSNIDSKDFKQVVAGHEKVMRARLSDAAFFFSHDQKKPLSSYIVATNQVIFQTKLGTLADKATRVGLLMAHLAPLLNLEITHARRAAALSKCDLMTGMVGEFPELQGIMGYYYALNDGEALSVAIALKEQYLPAFAGDRLPTTDIGWALSLAERLDTLVGIFAIGLRPIGDKDPFKLRRHALATVRLLIQKPVLLDLSSLLIQSLASYGAMLPDTKNTLNQLQSFILERLQSYYQSQGIPNDLIQAIRAKNSMILYDVNRRIEALSDFVYMPDAASLSAISKRVTNLLQPVKQLITNQSVEVTRLHENAEQLLYDKILATEKVVAPYYATGNYKAILHQLAGLGSVVDHFFEQVMVMVEDEKIKTNRLLVLSRLQTMLQGVADISLLQFNL